MEILTSITKSCDIKKLSLEERELAAKTFVKSLEPAMQKYLYAVLSFGFLEGDLEDQRFIFEQLGGNWNPGI